MEIIIADDHPLFVEGLKNLLQTEDFIIAGVVDNGEKAVEEILEKKPDVVLMDIGMPVLDGIEATKIIKSELPQVRIIILTSFEEEDSLLKAIKAGASGYLLKSLSGKELINSLLEIKAGKNPFSPGLEDLILDKLQSDLSRIENRNKELIEKLTEKQVEVLKLLVKGLTYQEIGDKVFLSERTIKYHMGEIKKKLSLKTQAQVISFARDHLVE